MAKKEFFCIVDSETTINDKVFDFAAVVCDRHGNIQNQCAIIVNEFSQEDLFYDNRIAEWSKANAAKKREMYAAMVKDGRRMVAGYAAVNRWLEKVIAKYNPMLTAYNLAFDSGKCANSGIDLTGFANRFCLWHLSSELFAKKKAYKAFALENHYFGNRTEKGNMVITTNAEKMAHFVKGEYNKEPHTALEDIIDFELPIMVACLKKRDWKNQCNTAYSWRDYIVKNHYKA